MFAIAQATALFSKDPSTKVGAVATKNKRVIGTGRNGFPPGIEDDPELYNDRELKYLLVNHAEKNLISICGDQIRGGDVFVTFPICNDCAGMLITAGVARVFVDVTLVDSEHTIWYARWNLSKAMFREAGVEIFEFNGVSTKQITEVSSVATAAKVLLEFKK